MRKILTFLCAALMSVGMFALTPSGTDTWDEGTKTLTVNSNPGDWGDYYYESEIVHVVISDAVTSIGEGAFAECFNLKSVTIGNSVTSIGQSAFADCAGLTSVTIGNNVESIGGFAFIGCTGLTSITIPNSVTSIGQSAFDGCTALTSIEIPNSVTSIGKEAFYSCSNLTSVTIGNSVTSIGADAFRSCTAVTDVYCYPNAADLTWNDNNCNDFKASKATRCHVPSNYYNAYVAKFDATVNVTFVGDQPASDFAITANEDPQNASVYYSTFYESTNKYELPDGVEAYVADLSGANLLLTKIAEAGEVIPADNAVILKSTVASFILTPSEADAVTFSATNSLQGVDADTEISAKVTGTCYVLSGTQAEGVGFFLYEAPNLLKAYKAFVDRPNGANPAPRRMRFIFDAATGVENVQGNVQSTKVLRDGQLIIIRNGVEYNANGMMVK